jgi:integrase
MGSIRRAPRSGRWEARFRDTAGRQRTATFDRKSDATVFLAAAETDVARGSWRDPALGRTPFSDIARDWLASNPRKRPTTYARDAMVVRVHLTPLLGQLPIARVTPADVKSVVAAMEHRGLAPATVRTSYGVLRAILSWAVENDVIDRSPCRGVRLPEPAKSSKPVVSAAEVQRLADAIAVDYRVAVFLGALGLRQAEVFGLRVGSVDFLRRTLTVRETTNEVEGQFVEGSGKTQSSVRTLSVPQIVLDELAAHLARTGRTAPDDRVLQSPGGGPVRATNFRLRIYGPALVKADLEGLTFHRLRHSAGHMMREAGVPLEVIQKRLGHASIRTTADIYGSLPEKVDRGVADQLDGLFASACGADVVQSQGDGPSGS